MEGYCQPLLRSSGTQSFLKPARAWAWTCFESTVKSSYLGKPLGNRARLSYHVVVGLFYGFMLYLPFNLLCFLVHLPVLWIMLFSYCKVPWDLVGRWHIQWKNNHNLVKLDCPPRTGHPGFLSLGHLIIGVSEIILEGLQFQLLYKILLQLCILPVGNLVASSAIETRDWINI